MTVEWDQKDMSVFEKQTEVLMKQLWDMTPEELITFLKENLTKEQINEIASQVKTTSREDLAPLILKVAKENEMKGASWNGTTTVLVTVAVIAVTVTALYTVFLHRQLECDGLWDCHGGE